MDKDTKWVIIGPYKDDDYTFSMLFEAIHNKAWDEVAIILEEGSNKGNPNKDYSKEVFEEFMHKAQMNYLDETIDACLNLNPYCSCVS